MTRDSAILGMTVAHVGSSRTSLAAVVGAEEFKAAEEQVLPAEGIELLHDAAQPAMAQARHVRARRARLHRWRPRWRGGTERCRCCRTLSTLSNAVAPQASSTAAVLAGQPSSSATPAEAGRAVSRESILEQAACCRFLKVHANVVPMRRISGPDADCPHRSKQHGRVARAALSCLETRNVQKTSERAILWLRFTL